MQAKIYFLALVVAAVELVAAIPPVSHDVVKARSPIVGGRLSKPNEAPYMVFIDAEVEGGSYSCGGTLISSRLVITARHCVEYPGLTTAGIKVYAGSHVSWIFLPT